MSITDNSGPVLLVKSGLFYADFQCKTKIAYGIEPPPFMPLEALAARRKSADYDTNRDTEAPLASARPS